ncbi:MAG: Dipeptidyl aminopeptidase/acylaminoacyl-peptidase-like protein [Acidobacteriales bacterium]|nr:Dipeptidyl aminopeptidase/acylaminoacyl-peptidase-like protein [Terriglobales bacterium]
MGAPDRHSHRFAISRNFSQSAFVLHLKDIHVKRKLRLFAYSVLSLYLLASFVSGIALTEFCLKLPKHAITQEYRTVALQRAAALHSSLDEVSIRTPDGTILRAWYLQPAEPNHDAAILLHGVTDNRLGVAGYAELLLKHGYSVLLPDMRDHGESDGQIASYGLREGGDIHQWVDWIYQTHPPHCVYGFGESMGAAIILQSLASESRFCAVAAESSFATFRDGAYDRVSGMLQSRPWIAKTIFRPAIEIGILYARLRYSLNLNQVSPEHAVSGSNTPVLLIHGVEDVNIWPRNSKAIHNANPRTDLWLVPRAAHCGAWQASPQEFETRLLRLFSQKRL